jgi:hypothetical protein
MRPGRYTISMSTEAHDISHVPVIHLSGEGVDATFLAIATPAHESGRNYLDIANIGGTYVIRAFDSGLLGESFSFGVTESVKNKALRASTEPAMAIPVSMGS